MLIMFIVSLLAALLLCCLLFPSVWASMAGDELLDAHEAGLALVASRTSLWNLPRLSGVNGFVGNPVRETGPPACMAKLIMLRHKVSVFKNLMTPKLFLYLFTYTVLPQINQANAKRRCSVSHARQAALTFHAASARPPRNATWGRFGRSFGKQYH